MARRPKRGPVKQFGACTRCGTRSEHWKYEFFRASQVKCPACGGNVVQARYSDIVKPIPNQNPSPSKPPKTKVRSTKGPNPWKRLKKHVVAARGSVCESCKTATPNPYLTRKHWRNKGRETPEDVELLCKECFEVKFESKRGNDGDELSREYQSIVRTPSTVSLQTDGRAPWED